VVERISGRGEAHLAPAPVKGARKSRIIRVGFETRPCYFSTYLAGLASGEAKQVYVKS